MHRPHTWLVLLDAFNVQNLGEKVCSEQHNLKREPATQTAGRVKVYAHTHTHTHTNTHTHTHTHTHHAHTMHTHHTHTTHIPHTHACACTHAHNAIHIAPCSRGSNGPSHEGSGEGTDYCILNCLTRGGRQVEELGRGEGEADVVGHTV